MHMCVAAEQCVNASLRLGDVTMRVQSKCCSNANNCNTKEPAGEYRPGVFPK